MNNDEYKKRQDELDKEIKRFAETVDDKIAKINRFVFAMNPEEKQIYDRMIKQYIPADEAIPRILGEDRINNIMQQYKDFDNYFYNTNISTEEFYDNFDKYYNEYIQQSNIDPQLQKGFYEGSKGMYKHKSDMAKGVYEVKSKNINAKNTAVEKTYYENEKTVSSDIDMNVDEPSIDIENLPSEVLANLTDEEIMEWAQNSDDYNEAIELRKKAREKLGMDAVPEIETTGKNTELETPLNNNLNNRTSNTNTSTIDNTIENESGPAKYDLDAPDVKTRKQRLENTGKRLSNNKGPNGTKKRFTGQRVANNSKRSIKKRKLSGKKFKVKGGNLKQAAANTFVNIATDAVKETIYKNADELKNFGKHPNIFEFDEFADLTDADIDFHYDNLFGMDIKTKKQMKKSWVEKRKLAKTARESTNKRKIIDNFDNYMDDVFSYTGYNSIEGQARFSPDPEVGWDEADFKNPDSYNRHRIDFEVDDDGNLKFKRYDEMETIEIEQNKSRRMKSNVADDDIFGWMKKHKLGLGEAINVLSTISSYKDARKQGHSVGSSMVRAAGSFVMGEMLGFWGSMGWELAKGIPKAAIKGAEVLYKENRKMNAAANQYGLGGDFQDTQQLATMRQSGLNR